VPRGTPRPRSLVASFVWLVGALGLLAVAVSQAIWQRPELLDFSPALRAVAERACAEIGCVVPHASDPDALRVQASALEPLDGAPGLSSLRVEIVNRASRAQLPPGLGLTLLDATGRVVARRVFRPDEFLAGVPESVAPGARLEVALAVEAPDTDFAGYWVDLVIR
jgi:hypothetical protein